MDALDSGVVSGWVLSVSPITRRATGFGRLVKNCGALGIPFSTESIKKAITPLDLCSYPSVDNVSNVYYTKSTRHHTLFYRLARIPR
jgi:hypothetical protein